MSSMGDQAFIALQKLLPQHLLSRTVGSLAASEQPWLKNLLIQRFARRYDIDMSLAANPDLTSYPSFNAFFTRPLRDGVRPIDMASGSIACPADGAISQLGRIDGDAVFQAKGQSFSLRQLIGVDSLAEPFAGGSFATVYLSPRDYHRVHMPLAGTLTDTVYVPGELFSVNAVTADHVPGLFARNERVVCLFDTAYGPFVLVLVGATVVGSMATVWHGTVNPPRPGRITDWHYQDQAIALKQGEEMGRFLLGSTVVMLFPRQTILFNPGWHPGKALRMGEAMGQHE